MLGSDASSTVHAVLCRAGMATPDDRPSMAPLSGGVSSDIWRVEVASGVVCVKRALAKLKVEADWRAPLERSAFEAAWLETAARIVPEAVPRLLYYDRVAGALVLPFLDPQRYRVWKSELRDGRAEADVAAAVGERLARIHRATAIDRAIAERFATDAIFHAIRLEPYLLATARRHPDLAGELERLVRRTAGTKLALVHGDASPKNILVGPSGPVFLDAECAWYGDPAFDLAFCLNHLFLKCLWNPGAVAGFLACFDALLETYMALVSWEPRAALEARVATLLPALLIARVDGKSPVEYLTEESEKDRVRRVARSFLKHPERTLAPLRRAWAAEVGAGTPGVGPGPVAGRAGTPGREANGESRR
ncbi:MAG: phosphotransferase [Geminicoccaceae bacterium]|nr:phosphotransferase [Geminicoccaceae bacterium]